MTAHDVTDTNVMGDINVTPMVDVMLVLLIIFMILTPAIMAGFTAKMPMGENLLARKDDDTRTTLGIDPSGQYYLNREAIRKEDALTLLKQEFERHPDDKVLFVKADSRLKYGVIIEAMDLAKKSGARVIAAVTEQPPGSNQEDLEIVNDVK